MLKTIPDKPPQFGWTDDRIQKTFQYHNPGTLADGEREATVQAYEAIRAGGGEFAKLLIRYCKATPELTRAINSIQDAVMRANAAIAINGINQERVRWEDAHREAFEKVCSIAKHLLAACRRSGVSGVRVGAHDVSAVFLNEGPRAPLSLDEESRKEVEALREEVLCWIEVSGVTIMVGDMNGACVVDKITFDYD